MSISAYSYFCMLILILGTVHAFSEIPVPRSRGEYEKGPNNHESVYCDRENPIVDFIV